MKIRRYREGDHDEVWSLHDIALRATNGAHAEDPKLYDDLHHIEESYIDSGGEFVVGVESGRIVAMGALNRSSSDRAEIKRMRVHPDSQRRGFGRAVLRRLEARAVELGYTALHLDTSLLQVAAQSFYVQNGYAETGRSKFGTFDIILYEKRLTDKAQDHQSGRPI